MYNNKLTIILLESSKEAMSEVSKMNGYDVMRNNHHLLSERGKYIMGVFKYFSRITSIVKDLEKIEVFLRSIQIRNILKKIESIN